MNRQLQARLRALEGKAAAQAADEIRRRLQQLGIGDPDPHDAGTAILIDNILKEISK